MGKMTVQLDNFDTEVPVVSGSWRDDLTTFLKVWGGFMQDNMPRTGF